MSRTYRSTKDITALIRETLRKELPQWKFSVSKKEFAGGASITLALMSGPEAVIAGYPEGSNGREWGYPAPNYAQLNSYSLRRDDWKPVNNGILLTEVGWNTMRSALAVIDAYHWDDSDIQSDYFSCNFYIHLEIGKWNKDYQVK